MPPKKQPRTIDNEEASTSNLEIFRIKVKSESIQSQNNDLADKNKPDKLKQTLLYKMLFPSASTTEITKDCKSKDEAVHEKTEIIEPEENNTVDSESESDDELTGTDTEESDQESTSPRVLQWSNCSTSMKSFQFTKTPMKVQLSKNPTEAFGTMFTEEFLKLIVRETNTVARRRLPLWHDVTVQEMLKFFGLVLHTGTIHINSISDYWNDHWLFNLPYFYKYMSLDRFLEILKHISFTSRKVVKNKKTGKVQPLMDHFNETMKRLVHPNAELLVQEPFPVSETRRGARLHSLCDDNGLTLKFILTPETHSKHFEKVVFDLLEGHLDCGHSVYIKDHFLSYDLATKLLERKTYSTGPLKEHASLSPMMISLPNTPCNFFADSIHIGRWQDLLYITTEHKDELMEVVIPRTGKVTMKPKVVIKYKNAISKINKSDISDTRKKEKSSLESFTAYYPHQRKDMRWDEKVFVHILNQWMINAYLLTPAEPFKTYYDFRLNILENLLPGEQKIRTESLRIPHTLTKIENVKIRHRNEGGKMVMRREVVRKDCKGCRALSRRGTTCFECKECEGSPGYCVGCFETAHK